MPNLELARFAPALAARLPGRWRADAHPTPLTDDPACYRIWDFGPLSRTAFTSGAGHRSVLTSGVGLQLYVAELPARKKQFVVAPLLPAGTRRIHTASVAAPRGITVPADPARAAAQVERRQLFRLRTASMSAQKHVGMPRLAVEITLDTDGRPRVTTVHTRALYELTSRGFRLDPASGHCYLPETLSREAALQRTRQAALRLDELGFTSLAPAADRTPGPIYRPDVRPPSTPATPDPGHDPSGHSPR